MVDEVSKRAARLRQARERAGFSKPIEAIERFRFKRSYYHHENGHGTFSFDQAAAYAKAYGVRAEWLYKGTGPMTDAPDSDLAELVRLWDHIPKARRSTVIDVARGMSKRRPGQG